MEIAIALLLLSGVGVVWLNQVQRSQRYAPYQDDEVQALRAIYQLHLIERTCPEFCPTLEAAQRQIWQEEQRKFAKEKSLHVDTPGFRHD